MTSKTDNTPVDYNRCDSSNYELDKEKLIKEESISKVTKFQFAILGAYALLCYVAAVGGMQIMSQYIYARYAKEVGLLPENSTASTCTAKNQTNNHSALQNEAQERAASLDFSNNLFMLPRVVSVIIMGAYSDKMGRKLTILIPWFGGVLENLSHAVWIVFDLPMWVYLVAQIPSSLTGGYVAMIAGMFSFLTDSSSNKKRSLAISLGEVGVMVSILVGSIVTGWCIKLFSYKISYCVMTSLMMLSGVFVFFLPETSYALRKKEKEDLDETEDIQKKDDEREDWTNGSLTPLQMVKNIIKVFTVDKQRARYLILLLIIVFLLIFVFFGGMSLTTLYLLNHPFCWNSVYLSYFTAVNVSMSSLGTFLLILFLRKRIDESWLVLIGLCSMIAGNTLLGFSSSFASPLCNYTVLMSIIAGSCSGVAMPILRTILTKLVNKYEIGLLFGLLASLESLAGTTGGLATSAIYKTTVSRLAGTYAFFQASIALLAVFFTIVYIWKSKASKFYKTLVVQ